MVEKTYGRRVFCLEMPFPGILCCKRFMIVADEDMLQHILVKNAHHYIKVPSSTRYRYRCLAIPSVGTHASLALALALPASPCPR